MAPIDLTPKEEEILRSSNLVVIIGLPASGKTTVAELLKNGPLKEHDVYSTDDYIDYGYEQSLYVLMKEMSYNSHPKKAIEGVQGYRFLRKAAERGIAVDVVIIVEAAPAERLKRYIGRGKGALPETFEKNLTKVFTDWEQLTSVYGHRKPITIKIHT